jgi:hypothetical protein
MLSGVFAGQRVQHTELRYQIAQLVRGEMLVMVPLRMPVS